MTQIQKLIHERIIDPYSKPDKFFSTMEEFKKMLDTIDNKKHLISIEELEMKIKVESEKKKAEEAELQRK